MVLATTPGAVLYDTILHPCSLYFSLLPSATKSHAHFEDSYGRTLFCQCYEVNVMLGHVNPELTFSLLANRQC